MQQRAERCETCRYWHFADESPSGEAAAECRRNPPAIVGCMAPKSGMAENYPDEPSRGLWPYTSSFDWCGEWKENETRSLQLMIGEYENVLVVSYNPEFSTRILNSLERGYGANLTIGELCRKTRDDLLGIPQMGAHSVQEIRRLLAANGLQLSG